MAAVLLTYMTFWMRSHARTIGAELRDRAEVAMERRQRFGLGLLAFQAVGREGLETAVFTLAIVFATGTRGTLPGAVAGLAVSLVVAVVIYRMGRKINLTVFFTAVGAVLMVFAAGLVADTVENLQQLGWVPWLSHQLWNTSGVLSGELPPAATSSTACSAMPIARLSSRRSPTSPTSASRWAPSCSSADAVGSRPPPGSPRCDRRVGELGRS